MTFTLEEQIDFVKREIAMREYDFPRWGQNKADSENTASLACMRAVLETLERAVKVRAGSVIHPR